MLQTVKTAWPPEVVAEMRENLANSDIGRDIHHEGRLEGRIEAFGHQFARRLGRPVTAAEHAELLRRLDALGADRIGDVVLDLAPDALAAWLADPNAT